MMWMGVSIKYVFFLHEFPNKDDDENKISVNGAAFKNTITYWIRFRRWQSTMRKQNFINAQQAKLVSFQENIVKVARMVKKGFWRRVNFG